MQRLSEGYTKSNFPNLVIDCIYIQEWSDLTSEIFTLIS